MAIAHGKASKVDWQLHFSLHCISTESSRSRKNLTSMAPALAQDEPNGIHWGQGIDFSPVHSYQTVDKAIPLFQVTSG